MFEAIAANRRKSALLVVFMALLLAVLGYALGEIARDRVAVIVGAPADTTEDELKALGAAAAYLAIFKAPA